MKKILSVILLLAVILTVKNNTLDLSEAISAATEARATVTYLLCGYDDAAENTDSIVIATYSFGDNSVSFVQIPRDTYYRDTLYCRINSIYPSARASGETRAQALATLKGRLSDLLGIRIDASIGYTMDTFVAMINAIGGIDLYMPTPFVITGEAGEELLSLSDGYNHLDGEASLAFVRARGEYRTGDLGRIDAQKLFISAFVAKLKNDVSAVDIVKACIATSKGWTIDAKYSDIFQMVAKNHGRMSNVTTKYASLPGKQVCDKNGVWYYCVAREPAVALFGELGIKVGTFDNGGLMLNSENPDFGEVYYSKDIAVKIYDDNTLSQIDVNER